MQTTNKPFLIIITGPTGVGKTRLCINLATAFNAPVISADSRQMYKEMKIGTAVPTSYQLKKVNHYFVNNLSIHDYYNASMFETESLDLLKKLFTCKKIVFMAGGSNLYIDAVCKGIDDLPTVDQGLRKDLSTKYQSNGIAWLRVQLKKLDPDHYEVVDLRNPNRMLKALEISLMTGKPYSSFLKREKKERFFNIIKIGLTRERNELYNIINSRVDEMMDQGLLKEAGTLYPFRHLNALNTVGYKELFDYFEEKTSLNQAIELIKRNSRRYCKRQLTWLAKDKEIHWFNPDDQTLIFDFIENQTGMESKERN